MPKMINVKYSGAANVEPENVPEWEAAGWKVVEPEEKTETSKTSKSKVN